MKALPCGGLLATPQANILFCRLPQEVTTAGRPKGYAFHHDRWEPGIVRFVTAFSHSAENVDRLLDAVNRHTSQPRCHRATSHVRVRPPTSSRCYRSGIAIPLRRWE
ncbi:hypothetical protein SAMN04488564_111301 [Lentzea waywayandensis]|uniref:Uncharacterized protein n=1 Tax=Lentzea waywayandensis TaxID=84724 RepID=A0A1I6FD70_9PSEU|nr:hypothetical protein [Lentzea waywayandensis]SFR27860.1 hypothetical protein SAMN04488564_111301 [Lentzea waywayandensis]